MRFGSKVTTISIVSTAANHLTRSGHASCEEGGEVLTMRILALVALAAAAIGLGACAKDEPATTTTSSATTTGYSK